MLDKIKTYCIEHYSNGWCDLVIETMDDADIREIIGDSRTLDGAIRKLRENLAAYADMRADISAEIF